VLYSSLIGTNCGCSHGVEPNFVQRVPDDMHILVRGGGPAGFVLLFVFPSTPRVLKDFETRLEDERVFVQVYYYLSQYCAGVVVLSIPVYLLALETHRESWRVM